MKHQKHTDVYIITQNGTTYDDEGCRYIADTMLEKHNINDIVFSMGEAYNNPTNLAHELKENPTAYIVLSDNPIAILYGDNIKPIIRALNDFPKETSWEIIKKILPN